MDYHYYTCAQVEFSLCPFYLHFQLIVKFLLYPRHCPCILVVLQQDLLVQEKPRLSRIWPKHWDYCVLLLTVEKAWTTRCVTGKTEIAWHIVKPSLAEFSVLEKTAPSSGQTYDRKMWASFWGYFRLGGVLIWNYVISLLKYALFFFTCFICIRRVCFYTIHCDQPLIFWLLSCLSPVHRQDLLGLSTVWSLGLLRRVQPYWRVSVVSYLHPN